MRANENVAHIPVIIITAARIGIKDVREGLTLGADDYITKPFDWRELSARIRTKLRVKKAEDALRQRTKKLGVLPEISLDLGERLDVEALTKTILARTVGALEATNGYLFIFQPDGSATFQMHEVYDLPAWTKEEDRNRMIADIVHPSEGVVAQVVANRQGMIIANTDHHEGWISIQRDETQSAILVPLLGREEVLGVLTLTHNQVGYFKPDHLTLLQAIASQSAIAIENAQLYATERRRVNELVALNQLTREISRFTRSTDLWENLPRLARETLRYPAVGLWLVDGEKLTLRGLAGQENAPRHSILEVAPLQAAETGQPAQFSGPIEERSCRARRHGQAPGGIGDCGAVDLEPGGARCVFDPQPAGRRLSGKRPCGTGDAGLADHLSAGTHPVV